MPRLKRAQQQANRPLLPTFMRASASGVSPLLLCESTAAPSATRRDMESHCPASAARCRAARGREWRQESDCAQRWQQAHGSACTAVQHKNSAAQRSTAEQHRSPARPRQQPPPLTCVSAAQVTLLNVRPKPNQLLKRRHLWRSRYSQDQVLYCQAAIRCRKDCTRRLSLHNAPPLPPCRPLCRPLPIPTRPCMAA